MGRRRFGRLTFRLGTLARRRLGQAFRFQPRLGGPACLGLQFGALLRQPRGLAVRRHARRGHGFRGLFRLRLFQGQIGRHAFGFRPLPRQSLRFGFPAGAGGGGRRQIRRRELAPAGFRQGELLDLDARLGGLLGIPLRLGSLDGQLPRGRLHPDAHLGLFARHGVGLGPPPRGVQRLGFDPLTNGRVPRGPLLHRRFGQ